MSNDDFTVELGFCEDKLFFSFLIYIVFSLLIEEKWDMFIPNIEFP